MKYVVTSVNIQKNSFTISLGVRALFSIELNMCIEAKWKFMII